MWNIRAQQKEPEQGEERSSKVVATSYGFIKCILLLRDGITLLCGTTIPELQVWEFRKLKKEVDSRAGYEEVDDDTIEWECAHSSRIESLKDHRNWVVTMEELEEDGIVATGSWDSTIKIWDIPRLICLRTLIGHTATVESVLSLGSGRLASSAGDGIIMIWDWTTGDCLQTLLGPDKKVSSLALYDMSNYSSDRKVLLSASIDKTIRMWDINQPTGSYNCIYVAKTASFCQSLTVLKNGTIVQGGGDGKITLVRPLIT